MTIKKQFFALVLILSYSIFSSAEASDISLLIKECDEGGLIHVVKLAFITKTLRMLI